MRRLPVQRQEGGYAVGFGGRRGSKGDLCPVCPLRAVAAGRTDWNAAHPNIRRRWELCGDQGRRIARSTHRQDERDFATCTDPALHTTARAAQHSGRVRDCNIDVLSEVAR